jgi:hypothetical protein
MIVDFGRFFILFIGKVIGVQGARLLEWKSTLSRATKFTKTAFYF